MKIQSKFPNNLTIDILLEENGLLEPFFQVSNSSQILIPVADFIEEFDKIVNQVAASTGNSGTLYTLENLKRKDYALTFSLVCFSSPIAELAMKVLAKHIKRAANLALIARENDKEIN